MSEKRTILVNFISLLVVQFGNYLLQLITFPYLVRVLGVTGFGLYSFVFSLTQYFAIITDYGFNLTATRQVSIFRNDKKKISEIFSSVMAVKLTLFAFSLIIIAMLIYTVPKFNVNKDAYFLSMLAILGNLIFPVWYYQGIEKTKYIALINFAVKLVSTLCIFTLVKNQDDVNLTIAIYSLSVVMSGAISMIILIKLWPIRISLPSRESFWFMLKDGWNVFATLLAASLINNTSIFILGIFTDNQIVGFYSIAERIVRVFHNLVSPLSTAIFPYVSRMFSESSEKAIQFLRKVALLGGIAFTGCSLLLILFSGLLVKIFTGSNSMRIQTLILILSILPLSIFIDNIYGQQILVNIGRTKEFMKSILIPGCISLMLSLIFVPIFKDYATAVLYLTSELALLGSMIYFTRREEIFLFRNKFI